MEAGFAHVIMMDHDNHIWSFGGNSDGQCGDGTKEHINEPKELIMFRDCEVNEIKCSRNHSYLRCDKNKHYLWGSNKINECLAGEDVRTVTTPQLLELDGMTIIDVFLGYENTKLIVLSE